MFAKIVENPTYEPKSTILAIEEKFRYQISYGKAYMANKKVMDMRWGTYEASYDNLPRLLNTIATLNPGSYYDIKTYNLVSRPGKQVLQRAFLALGPAIAAFKQCRPVICIDGTFLTGKYKGTIVVWTSLGPLPRWVPGPTTRWAPGDYPACATRHLMA
jgi:hypothetical protein